MKKIWSLLLLAVLVLLPQMVSSQEKADSITIWVIRLVDDNEFIGNITRQDEASVTILTEVLGEITIPRNRIRSISPVGNDLLKGGEYWFDNPHSTRYFYGPNGYGLKSGEGYYQNTWVLFNQVSIGLSDYLSFGAGMMPLFLFGGVPTPVWITPKFSIPVVEDRFNIGGGVLAGTIVGESMGGFGVGYGVVTFGDRDNNATFGLGMGFSSEDGLADVPTFLVSGMTRISRRGYLVTENYYLHLFGEGLVIISAGGRSVRKSLAIDFGLILPFTSNIDFVAIPWIGITMPFDTNQNR